jgi:undecaprenyl-diphosphatase
LVYAAILLRGILDKRPGLTRTALVYLAVQLVLSLLLVRLLKISLGRPRPGEGLLYHPMTLEPSHHSLPSGHTCEITAASLPLSLWRRGLLLSLAIGVLTGAVGASRVILGWHHISDVFFGWLLGMVGALAIYLFGVQHANR